MATIYKVQFELNGWDGAPGINSWYCVETAGPGADLDDWCQLLASFYDNLKVYWAAGVSAAILPAIRGYDHASGDLVFADSAPTIAPIVSTGSSSASDQSRASQLKLQFVTDKIRRNRLLRGGIFFGPINGNAIEGDGTVEPDVKTAVATAVEGLLDIAGDFRLVVWGQPIDVGAGDDVGVFGHVQQVTVADKPAVLRSRRD